MTTINYIIDDSIVNRLTSNRKWLDSYVPSMVKRINDQGIDVVFDRESDFDIMHIHIPMTLAYRLSLANNNGNHKPAIFHGHMTEDTFMVNRKIKYFLRKWLQGIAEKSDIILCPSLSTAEYYQDLSPDNDIRQLNYGIDIDRYAYSQEAGQVFREQYRIKDDKKVVCCIGGLTQRKGVSEFCEVARRYPDMCFMWVGGKFYNRHTINGLYSIIARDDRPDLKNLPANVKFIGYTSNIPGALSASDIFFFPSRQETQGLALIEAAANGLPIIARDLPVFREWLTHGVNCLMGNSVDEFSEHIRTFTEDISLAERLGSRALTSAREYHDIDITSRSLAGMYQELAG